jgi:hypothetical protein
MTWNVNWQPLALSSLAAIWNQSTKRQSITAAAAMIDRLLARDALANGTPVSEGLYSIEIHPLRVLFEIAHAARSVDVVSVNELP